MQTIDECRAALECDVRVNRCARCGEDHDNLKFRRFNAVSPGEATHWAMCPSLNEPIRLTFTEERFIEEEVV